MNRNSSNISKIAVGLYVDDTEPGIVYASPKEILESKGLPVTQESCAALFITITNMFVEEGITAVLIQELNALSNVDYLKSTVS